MSTVELPVATLLELTQIPTAAGREHRVVEWIRNWVSARPDLHLAADAAGNLVVSLNQDSDLAHRGSGGSQRPLFITAHLDHPAFVVEQVINDDTLILSFRGGVMDDFFPDAPVVIHEGASGRRHAGRLTGAVTPLGKPFKRYTAELSAPAPAVIVGDIGCWDLPPSRIDGGLAYTPACDDLAAAAAALECLDRCLHLAGTWDVACAQFPHLLFTRAEEIGLVGATAACRLGTIPANARVLALENSRAFDDSPIGGGPIVRVGDRLTIFTPDLTTAVAARAELFFGRPAQPLLPPAASSRPWQRKLMAGGACEASVFCAYGLDATCICLPLGNYHNMAHLSELQGGRYDRSVLGPPRAAPEVIAVADYLGMIDLLVALCEDLPNARATRERLDRLHDDLAFVLK